MNAVASSDQPPTNHPSSDLHDVEQPLSGSGHLLGRRVITILLAVFFAVQLTRIVQVRSETGETPFFSANDRSRWCTIAALSITGGYEVDPLLEIRDPRSRRRTWYTIDLVRHFGTDGKLHYYSSKPPLLPTLYAGVYMAVRAVTGLTLMQHPFIVVPIMLVLVNLIPLTLFYLVLLRWFVSRAKGRDTVWHVILIGMFVCWGCYLSTFVTTINNHLPGALAAGVALWCLDRIGCGGQRQLRWFALCGFSAAFAVTCELPALSWFAAAAAICGWINWKRTLLGFGLGAVPVAAAFLATNYLAHGTWTPAYAHRSLGPLIAERQLDHVPESLATLASDPTWRERLISVLRDAGLPVTDAAQITTARRREAIEVLDETAQVHVAIVADPSGSTLRVYRWDDWYDYPSTYWTPENKRGVDRGEPSRWRYAVHVLIGHHGILSLTPFWFLAIGGAVRTLLRTAPQDWSRDTRWQITVMICAVTVVVLVFYTLLRGQQDRNYGGIASGFRWAFWLIPLWLYLAAEPLQHWPVQHKWWRWLLVALVAWSAFSACYAWTNPWTHPWLFQLWNALQAGRPPQLG